MSLPWKKILEILVNNFTKFELHLDLLYKGTVKFSKEHDTLKKMEKSTDITEDERKEGEEKIQKMTDKYVAKIDKSVENKSKEIMTV